MKEKPRTATIKCLVSDGDLFVRADDVICTLLDDAAHVCRSKKMKHSFHSGVVGGLQQAATALARLRMLARRDSSGGENDGR